MADIYEYGVDHRIQNAQRADGQWFERHRSTGRFGYGWTKWSPCAAKNERAGLNTYAGQARLPKD